MWDLGGISGITWTGHEMSRGRRSGWFLHIKTTA
jgi:hypothetical protein